MTLQILSKLAQHCQLLKPYTSKRKAISVPYIAFKKLHTNQIPVKELQIPTQWGHVSAKLWGREDCRPILAVHGWQDNAGSWDPLAPMLAKGCSILAVDLPGHGFSSWFPPGMSYYSWVWPNLILTVKEHFKWDKITLLCHSMGAIAGLRFASLYSEDVDTFIAIDSLIADDYDLDNVVDKYPRNLKKLLKMQQLLDSEPPSYTYEDMKKVWHLGTHKSVSVENTTYLMERGAKQTKIDPNKYYFSRDSRLKYILFNPEDKKFVETYVSRLQCPTLYIKATESPYSTDPFSVRMREFIAENNKKFEMHFIPGTHHVHLNNPERVAPLVIPFLTKYSLFNERDTPISSQF